MITTLLKQSDGYSVRRGNDYKNAEQITCVDKTKAIRLLEDLGIGYFEIEDAIAAMTAHGTDAVEFGINNTFIRCFNTRL